MSHAKVITNTFSSIFQKYFTTFA